MVEYALIYRLEPNFLNYIFSALGFHKNISAEISGIRLQCTNGKITTSGCPFVFQFETFDPVVSEKIFHDQLCLCFAITVTLIWQCQFYCIIKIFC